MKFQEIVKNKEDKINKGEHRSKNATPTKFKNGNKQIENENKI